MTSLEIIETTFKALHKRTDEAFETVEGIKKQHDKTTSGMNNVVDTIREMREKVRNLMSLQDDIAHQFKNVDKLVMGNAPGDFEPVKRVKKETKKSSFDDDMDYKPASKVKFDELSDDDTPAPKAESVEVSDEEPAKEEPAVDEDAERAAALEEAAALEAEFEADEAALEAGEEAAAEEAPAEEVDEEAEARKIAELELQQLEEEEKRLAEEEELRRLEEEEKRLAEEEELRRLEAEEEELKRLAAEEEALKAEEEELRRLEEEEAAAKAEEEKKAAEEEAKKKAPPKGKPGKFQFGNQLKTGGNKNKVVFK